jgi:hypothetical protein
VERYGSNPFNAIGSRMLFNLRSLLYAVGVVPPDLFVVGVVATVMLWWQRWRFSERDLVGVLVAVALLFGYSHSYDLAALVLLAPSFWRHLHRRPGPAMVALAMFAVVTFPNSVLERFGSDVLVHARVAIVLAAVGWLLALSARAVESVPEPQRTAA